MDDYTNFYTVKGYLSNSTKELTPTMEDYLEMIYRLLADKKVVRIGELSEHLNVKPSSASKIVQILKELDYVQYEKYSYITLTEKGDDIGKYLYHRHFVLQKFLCLINNSQDELEQVENIEHFLNKNTIDNISKLTEFLENRNYN